MNLGVFHLPTNGQK